MGLGCRRIGRIGVGGLGLWPVPFRLGFELFQDARLGPLIFPDSWSGPRLKLWCNRSASALMLCASFWPRTNTGWWLPPWIWRPLDRELEPLQSKVMRDHGLPAVPHGRVKQFLCSPLLLRWGVSGVYIPFTGEPNVVIPAAPGLLPAVAAHERAHLSGLAHEDDASFLALLTTWNSARAEVRYSGYLSLWLHLGRGAKDDPPAVARDLRAIRNSSPNTAAAGRNDVENVRVISNPKA